MIELPLIFAAGILGSGHCLGMCGGFALAIGGAASSWRNNFARQLVYTFGRVFTYVVIGATVGFFGSALDHRVPALLSIPAAMSLIAGVVLVYQGLLAGGWVPKRGVTGHAGCMAGSQLATLLKGQSWLQVFLAGLFTGMLPCGLLYGIVALAASSRSMPLAMAVMLVFGLGTAPLMILTGFSGQLLSVQRRRDLFRVAAICLVLTGLISMVRGVTALANLQTPEQACPFCAASK